MILSGDKLRDDPAVHSISNSWGRTVCGISVPELSVEISSPAFYCPAGRKDHTLVLDTDTHTDSGSDRQWRGRRCL